MIDAPENGLKAAAHDPTRLLALIICLVLALLDFAVTAHRATAATGTATISGTVYDASQNAITSQDVCVQAMPTASGGTYAFATAGSSGAYTLTGLAAGSYYVYFFDCYNSARNDLSQYYGGASVQARSAAVILSNGGSQSGIDATLAPATSISGHVYGGAGTGSPLSGVCVQASGQSSGQFVFQFANTASDGSYQIKHLVPGVAYKVEFQPCSGGAQYAPQYYNGAAGPSQATTVKPTLAAPATGIDANLVVGGMLSGTVYDSKSSPITTADICVWAIPTAGGNGAQATTDGSGDYSISGLAPGSYDVEFYDCSNSARNDVSQYYVAQSGPPYGGTGDMTSSTPVLVSSGAAATGIDATLAAGTSISGTVYGGAGTSTPLGQICVEATGVQPAGSSYTFEPSYSGETDSLGNYTIEHVAPSTTGYRLWFTDCNTPATYIQQYYNSSGTGSSNQSTATPVFPTASSYATGIDANLVEGGSIAGQITDASGNPITSGVCVDASQTGSGSYGGGYGGGTSPNGDYSIGGLAPGTYSVSFYDCAGTRNDLSLQLPSDVAVTSGAVTTANAVMQAATTISGTVYGCSQGGTSLSNSQLVYGCTGTQTPLGGVCVYASAPKFTGTPTVLSAHDGTYTVTHIDPTQKYRVRFFPCSSASRAYEPQYYDEVSSPGMATPVTSTLATPATNIDASLPHGAPVATITGGPANNAATAVTDNHFSFRANVNGATFTCSLDGASFKVCKSPYDTGTLAPGVHTFSVKAHAGGLKQANPPTVSWTIDPTTTTSASQGTLAAGQTFSSDPGGTTSASVPVIVGLTPPVDADVTLTTGPATSPSGNGYTVFGQQVDISATGSSGSPITGTPSAPIALTFTLDSSQIPAGTNLSTVTVMRDGTPAADCTSAGIASPDPCVQSLAPSSRAGVQLIVLTTHCSTWNFARVASSTSTSTTTSTAPTAAATTSASTPTTPLATSPAVTTQPSGATVRAALGSVLTPKGKSATVAAVRRHSSYSLVFEAPGAGELIVDWYHLPAGARLPKHSKRPKAELVGSARLHAIMAGRYAPILKLNGAGRRLLAHDKRLKLTAYAGFTPTGGTLTGATRSFTLKP